MRTGNNMKLEWANKELAAFNTMPKYNYIPEAEVAPQNLKVSASIPDADDIYYDAQEIDKKAMLEWLSGRVAKWWEPDDVLFVDELPHTATGKLNKLALREQYKDYSFPDV